MGIEENVIISNATIDQFIDIMKQVYASNENIRKVHVGLHDEKSILGMIVLGMTFRHYGHLTEDLKQKLGEIDVSGIGYSKNYSHLFPEKSELYRTEKRGSIHRIIDVPIDTLYELTLNSFRANNLTSPHQ